MSSDVAEKAKKILSNNEYLKEFAALNQLTGEAAKALLERLMREPIVSEQVEKFVFSDEGSPELKGYYSGEEKGYTAVVMKLALQKGLHSASSARLPLSFSAA